MLFYTDNKALASPVTYRLSGELQFIWSESEVVIQMLRIIETLSWVSEKSLYTPVRLNIAAPSFRLQIASWNSTSCDDGSGHRWK